MLVLDIEATGLNYQKHSIVSIGAFDFNNPENRFYEECRIWDGAHIDDEALEVNGFTKSEVRDENKMTEPELMQKFSDWSDTLENRTLVGQNIATDREMLQAAFARAGMNFNFAHRVLDSHTMCWTQMTLAGIKPPFDSEHKRSALNLDAVLNYCGIPDEPDPHNALTGALCHGEVVSRLLYNKKLLPEFSEFEIPWLK
ncbi:MAG: 3'-5' exonuclease [Candidatus Pacebacteria bacterium]|nr:3'-5' exonuclease [Candidatus Paceibacterota bacterium]